MALHSLAVRTAIEKKYKINNMGENTADEYGGKKHLKGKYMNNDWKSFWCKQLHQLITGMIKKLTIKIHFLINFLLKKIFVKTRSKKSF